MSMWITRLELRNIKSYGDPGQAIEFRPGVNLIQGENGAGKSTILEAIGLALFDSRTYSHERFVSEGASSGEIIVGFISRTDEREYHVVREVGGRSSYTVYDPQINQRLHTGKEDATAWVRDHLGVAPDADLSELFRNAIGVPQGTMTAIFLEPPAQRKEKFNRLLRVEDYRKAFDNLNDTRKYIEGLIRENENARNVIEERLRDLPETEAEIERLAGQVAQDRGALETTQARLSELAAELAILDGLKDQLDALDDDIQGHQRDLDRLEGRLDAAQKAVTEAEEAAQIVAETQEAFLAYEAAQERLVRLREADRARYDLATAAQRRDETKTALADLQARLATYQAQFQQRQALEAQREALEQERIAAQKAAAQAGATLESIARERRALGEHEALLDQTDARCPVCQRPLDEHTRAESKGHYAQERDRLNGAENAAQAQRSEAEARLADLQGQRRALDEQINGLAGQAALDDLGRDIEHVQTTLADRQREVTALEAALAQFADLTARLDDLDAEIAAAEAQLEASRDDHQRHLIKRETAAQLEDRRAGLATLQAQQGALEAQKAGAQQRRDALAADYDAARHESLRREHHEQETAQAVIAERLRGNETQLEAAQSKKADLGQRQEELATLEREAARLAKRQEAFDFVRKGIRDAGPRITRQLVRAVAAEANRIFGDIMGDSSFVLNWSEDYAISVNYRAEERAFELLSGGEQMAAAIAVRLALLTQLADVRFAFFDEPTANLDGVRREQLAERLGAIRSLQQVFVISHDNTFEGDSDHIIEVRKVNGISQVETR